jgi:predicted RND superfamily exporter protein
MNSIGQRIGAFFGRHRSIGFGLERIGFLTLKHMRVMAVLVIAFTALCAAFLPRANVDGDLLRVFAHSGPHYDNYARLSESFGTFENDIYLLINSPNLTDPEVLEQLRELAFDVELNEYAVGTLSPFSLRAPDGAGGSRPAVPEGMTSPEQVSAALLDLQQNDPMMRNLITPDLTGLVLIMFPNADLARENGTAAMIASLRDLITRYQSPEIQIELTGPPVWTSEMLNAAVDDQVKFTVYGFSLGALIALFGLRSFWGALIVASSPFMAVLWTMGTILMLFGSFSFLTIIVTTVCLVVAFSESMFFVYNWLNFWRDGMDPREAVGRTVRQVGPASALTMLTTAIAFGTLALAPGQGIQEFAVAGVIGSFITFLVIMTFLPLVLFAALRLGLKLPRTPNMALTAALPFSWTVVSKWGRPIALASILATGLLLIPYFLIQPRFSFEDFVANDSTALTAAEEIDEGVGGVAPLYIRVPMADSDPNVSDADYETIRRVHEILEGQLGENKVISAAAMTHYTEAGFTRGEVLDAVGPFMRQRFVTDDGSEALVTGFMPTIVDSDVLKQIVADTQGELDAAGIAGAEVGGFRLLTTFATDDIVRNLQLCLTLSVLVNIGVIGFAFRSFRVALASAIPNLFPILGTEAWLWFSGAGLQLTTVLALTIAFGIAVNDTIHFLSHYLHDRRNEGKPHAEAVRHTILRIGGAIVATTIILCAGTAVVAFSELPQVAMFGQLFVLSIALALLGDLFILPALLIAGGRFFDPVGKTPPSMATEPATAEPATGRQS